MKQFARKTTMSEPAVTNGMCVMEFVGGEFVKASMLTETTDLRVEVAL